MRYTVRTLWSQLPCLAAGTLWAVYVALTVLGVNVGADDEGRLFGMATVCLTFWALMCHRDRRRQPRPGMRMVSVEELAAMERAMLSGLLAGQGGELPERHPRSLRSV